MPGGIYIVVPLFTILAVLLLSCPIIYLMSYYEEQQQKRHNLKKQQLPLYNPHRASTTNETIELRTLRSTMWPSNNPIASPPQAKVKPTRQSELNRSKPQHAPNPYAASVTQAAQCDLDRSDSNKSDLSTADTIVSRPIVTEEMRRESILTANSSPLPKIMPNSDGFFEAAYNVPKRGDSLREKPVRKLFAEEFHRTKSQRGKTGNARGNERFEDVELGGDVQRDFA